MIGVFSGEGPSSNVSATRCPSMSTRLTNHPGLHELPSGAGMPRGGAVGSVAAGAAASGSVVVGVVVVDVVVVLVELVVGGTVVDVVVVLVVLDVDAAVVGRESVAPKLSALRAHEASTCAAPTAAAPAINRRRSRRRGRSTSSWSRLETSSSDAWSSMCIGEWRSSPAREHRHRTGVRCR